MAVVREDVVKLSFDFNNKELNQANDAVDDLVDKTQELGGPKGTGKAEDGFEEATKAAKKFGNTDLSGLSDGIDKIVSGVGKFALKAGGMAVKGLAAGAAAGTAALFSLGKAAVAGYSEYEQLVGGVETLFKKSDDTVIKYANDAYKTAGLSANEYMSTVTSFSASLLQSLDGDTAKAAKYADQAMVDMSDNANKMGTDMGMIQNAYQGFAKQNYTMLDNLKLGYGGTKEEMQRLLKDAEKLTGKKYDISNFADITEAIHAIQVEMGIAGTTAKEASETIQGSALAMKSAWGNFLVGMADENADFDQLTDNLVDSVITFSNNLIPRIQKMLPRLVRGLTKITKNLGKHIPGILEDLVPSLVDGVVGVMGSIYDVAVSMGPVFRKAGMTIVKSIYKGITGKEMSGEMFANFEAKVDQAFEAVKNITAGIWDFGKKLLFTVGPALMWIGDLALDAFSWIGDNINWILPVLGSLLGAMLAFKAVKKVTGIVSGFMSIFGKGKGKGGAAETVGGGKSGGGLFGGFANLKPSTVLKAIANIGIIVIGLGALAMLLAWAAPYFSELTDAGSFGKFMLAIGVVGLVGTGLTNLAGKVGNIPVATVTKGLANIAIAMGGMALVTVVLGWVSGLVEFDTTKMFKLLAIIGITGLVGSALAGLSGLIGAIPIAAVLAGLGNIALALGGFTAIVEAFGLLTLIPGFNDFLTKGGEVLTQICGILGEMVGSIVGGIAEGVTNSLPAIGDNLSAFATSIKPMFETFSSVDSEGLKNFSVALAALIGVIAGEKLVSVITGGINYAELGTNLSTMASNMSGFFSTIMTFPEGGFEKATALFSCLANISSLPKEGGVVGWFQGEVDYAKMATGLNQLAGTVGFFTAIQELPEAAFTKATQLFDCLAGIKSLPKDGGVTGWFQGEVNFESIVSGIQLLAGAGMITALTAISALPETAFTSLTSMFNALASIKTMPKSGGIAGWFAGEETATLNNVASQLPGVATNIASFFTNLGGITDFTPIKTLFDTLSSIEIDSDAADKGFLGLGSSDLESMGAGLSSFATKAATFFTKINDLNLDNMKGFFAELSTVADLPSALSSIDGTFGTTLSNIVTTVEDGMDSMKDAITTGLTDCCGAFKGKTQTFYRSGVSVMQGLNRGMKSMRSTLVSTAHSIASSIARTINKAMDIHSPSRVTFESGTYIGQGLVEGMRSTVPEMQVAAREVSYASIPYESNYSPDSSTTYYNDGDSEVTTIAPVFNLTISGSQDDRATARKVKRYVSEAIAETFASMERKSRVIREV